MKHTASQYAWAEQFNQKLLAAGVVALYFPAEQRVKLIYRSGSGINADLYNELHENRYAFVRYLQSLQFAKGL